MEELEFDDIVDKEYIKDENVTINKDIEDIISNLKLYSNNPQMLTYLYTNILTDDNVVYILTRISQDPIFMEHFPEFYVKNANDENVINCQQNSPYHRYGVFKHILYTIENVAKDSLKYNTNDMKILKWTMLLHDIGKPLAKSVNSSGQDSFAGHDDISVEIAADILDRFDFEEEDKNLILTLIKYHDRYLNEGDLTYDNLSFLASELGNRKELFNFLIEVKIADNKSKSLDVYNKFMTVVGKYYDFANEYFSNEEQNMLFAKLESDEGDELIEEGIPKNIANLDEMPQVKAEERGIYTEGGNEEDITADTINDLAKQITAGNSMKCYYQPVIDLKKRIVQGYEVYYKIITDQDFSYKQIMKKAKELDKYDKLQQMLFVNAVERFIESRQKQKIVGYINIDVKSYLNYVNKSRIYDLIQDQDIVLEFNNSETLINSKIKELAEEIYKRRCSVAVDNFESTKRTIKDIEQIEPKYIKFKLMKMDETTEKQLQELSVFCVSESINLIVTGVDKKEHLEFANKCDIRYVQGEYFSKPTEGLYMDTEIIDMKIEAAAAEELIV